MTHLEQATVALLGILLLFFVSRAFIWGSYASAKRKLKQKIRLAKLHIELAQLKEQLPGDIAGDLYDPG